MMTRNVLLTAFFFLVITSVRSQVVSGPMLGPIEYRDAKVWVEVTPQVKSVSLQYKKKARPDEPVGRGIQKQKLFYIKGNWEMILIPCK